MKAIYNCVADNPDELTFSEGEVIVVDGEEDQEWWVSISGEDFFFFKIKHKALPVHEARSGPISTMWMSVSLVTMVANSKKP